MYKVHLPIILASGVRQYIEKERKSEDGIEKSVPRIVIWHHKACGPENHRLASQGLRSDNKFVILMDGFYTHDTGMR